MTRYLVLVLVALTSCGGGKGSTEPTGPHLTFTNNATQESTSVEVGQTGDVNIQSNTSFTIQAPGVTAWSYSWSTDFPAVIDAHAYSSSLGGETYTAKLATMSSVQYIVSATFGESGVATVRINVTSGATCDSNVTCSGLGTCVVNEAGYPVCDCPFPFRISGFDCVVAGSCMLPVEDKCIDYIGWYLRTPQEQANCEHYEGTHSTSACVTPSGKTVIGYCRVQNAGMMSHDLDTVFSYYDGEATAALTDCEDNLFGTWTAAE